jgi:NaMN:DMB phosphoribosyltransferase
VGAGPLPRVDHPPRPPIPIVALDEEAMAAARERGEGELAVWLAGVAGAERRRIGRVDAAVARGTSPRSAPARPALTVAEVAAAVDTGRDVAAKAAADGIAVLIASAPPADEPALSLIAALTDDPAHPLRALRHLGTEEIAVLCGIALGAGEHGLGLVCDGLAALAGAAVAAGIEPALLPRLRAVTEHQRAAGLGIAAIDAAHLD